MRDRNLVVYKSILWKIKIGNVCWQNEPNKNSRKFLQHFYAGADLLRLIFKRVMNFSKDRHFSTVFLDGTCIFQTNRVPFYRSLNSLLVFSMNQSNWNKSFHAKSNKNGKTIRFNNEVDGFAVSIFNSFLEWWYIWLLLGFSTWKILKWLE